MLGLAKHMALIALLPVSALAAPSCAVEEICTHANDNCDPADGTLVMRILPNGKVEVTLNDKAPLQATALQMQDRTIMIFGENGEEHQLRLESSGAFNYLISLRDPEAPKGKDQTLYRGQCVEG